MNQFDVIDAKSPLRGIPCPKYWDLSSKLGILERNLIGSGPIMENLSFWLIGIYFLSDSNNMQQTKLWMLVAILILSWPPSSYSAARHSEAASQPAAIYNLISHIIAIWEIFRILAPSKKLCSKKVRWNIFPRILHILNKVIVCYIGIIAENDVKLE